MSSKQRYEPTPPKASGASRLTEELGTDPLGGGPAEWGRKAFI